MTFKNVNKILHYLTLFCTLPAILRLVNRQAGIQLCLSADRQATGSKWSAKIQYYSLKYQAIFDVSIFYATINNLQVYSLLLSPVF